MILRSIHYGGDCGSQTTEVRRRILREGKVFSDFKVGEMFLFGGVGPGLNFVRLGPPPQSSAPQAKNFEGYHLSVRVIFRWTRSLNFEGYVFSYN